MDKVRDVCWWCKRPECVRAYYRICSVCLGEGCRGCRESIIPGIVRIDTQEPGCIDVCTDWGDPEVDAGIDDRRENLISCLTEARNQKMGG